MLRLVWYGAKITRSAIAVEKSGVLRKIDDGLRELNRTKIPKLMNDKEKRYTWNLAFVLAKTYPGNAVKIYYSVLPFISFYGMFMEPKPKNRLHVYQTTTDSYEIMIHYCCCCILGRLLFILSIFTYSLKK